MSDPQNIQETLTDKFGRRYDIERDGGEDEGVLILDVWWKILRQRVYVGRSICNFHSNGEMELGDIEIFERAMVFGWPVIRSLIKRNYSFRRRGVGTELLKFVLSEAEKRHMKRLFGDIRGKEFLPAWYRANGFTVVDDARFYRKLL